MVNQIETAPLAEFIGKINTLREMFPAFARELDRCLFEVLERHAPKCGHGDCACQNLTFAHFHAERNLKFARDRRRRERQIS